MQNESPKSPRIDEVSWGHMQVAGLGRGKDFKLWPGGGRAWDWNETGTRHEPGIQPADIEELLEHGSRTIVLTRGMLLRLSTCRETLELLEAKGIEVHVAETREAVKIYNGFVTRGELTIKGVTRTVAVPFGWELAEGGPSMRGRVEIDRRRFGVGPDDASGVDARVTAFFELKWRRQ